MRRKSAIVLTFAGVGAIMASFFLPADFAWNGLNSFMFCMNTSGYASGPGSRLIWLGFGAAVLYQYAWAASTGVAAAMEWHRPSLATLCVAASAVLVGSLLVAALGVSLIAMRETWPPAPAQWLAAVCPFIQVGALWFFLRRTSPERRTPVANLVGAVPFLAANACVGVVAWQYGSPVWGFALAAGGALAILGSSCLSLSCWKQPDRAM
jgi:hypothetical protein